MSRVEENKKLNLPNSFRDDIQVQIAQAKFLEDISRSLAQIADALERQKPTEGRYRLEGAHNGRAETLQNS